MPIPYTRSLARPTILRRLLHPRLLSLGLTVGAGWGSRIVGALAQFVAVRILTAMLGVDGFGAWAVITGLLAWFMLADLGLGAALQNYISAQRVAASTEELEARTIVTMRAAIGFLCRMTALLWLLLAIASPWAGPFLLEGFAKISSIDAAIAFFIFGAIAIAVGASSIALKICFAEHRGYLAHFATAGGAVLGLAGLVLVAHIAPYHRLSWALFANYSPVFCLSAFLLYRRLKYSSLVATERRHILRPLLSQAGHFLLFSSLSALVLNIDFIVLARTVSPGEVATYAVFVKIYGLVFFIFSSVLQAYWPLSAEAFQRGDTSRLRALMTRCIGFGVLTIIGASIALLVLHEHIADVLAPGRNLVLPSNLILYFSVYWVLRVWSDTFSTIVLSAGRAMFLCKIVPIQAILSVGLGAWGANHYALPGFMLGMSASFVLTVMWILPFYVRRLMRQPHEAHA